MAEMNINIKKTITIHLPRKRKQHKIGKQKDIILVKVGGLRNHPTELVE